MQLKKLIFLISSWQWNYIFNRNDLEISLGASLLFFHENLHLDTSLDLPHLGDCNEKSRDTF